jgi:formylmethanofuran dehydrogenase subunit A
MDQPDRQDFVKRVHCRGILKDLDREDTLNEIAITTRASCARILGFPHR